ncbi:MAG TPA: helix-turn-helix transcriptional regulator [Planosporangium sp.]|nr:helix-turn-helix transcriptional regulator [Planosporangium sp.]
MFGEIVRANRLRLGATQEELARTTGLGVRTIRDVETGRIGRPRPGTVRLLADAFTLRGADRDRFHECALPGTDGAEVGANGGGAEVEEPAEPGSHHRWSRRWSLTAGFLILVVAIAVVIAVYTKSAESQAMTAHVSGTWTGDLAQNDGRHWSVRLRIAEGAKVATVTYAELGCVGTVTINRRGVDTLDYDEHITSGPCTPDGTITLRRRTDGRLDFSYVPRGDVYTASAVLTRSGR